MIRPNICRASLPVWICFVTASLVAMPSTAQPRSPEAASPGVHTSADTPRPAEIMPLASKSLVLGIVNTGKHLVAVGGHGDTLTSNDGLHWVQVQAPVRSALTAVAFADENHGWAVGHDAVILHTIDGGVHWTLQNYQPALENPFLSVLALDANHALAVGAYGLFYSTSDAGITWASVDAPAVRHDGWHLYSIRQLGDGDLLIAGEQGFLALSTDAGENWQRLKSPYEGTFFGAVPVGQKGALICGLRGNAFLSRDVAGGSWQKLATPAKNSLYGCRAVNADSAVMVGLNGVVELVDTHTGRVRNVATPGSTPYSDVTPFLGGLVLVGESGIQRIPDLSQATIAG